MALRVGFLGVAHMHCWGYLDALRKDPRATPGFVWDAEGGRRDRFALQGALSQAGSVDELLDKVDAVVICSENRRHAEHIEFAAKAGKPILCEKPLVTSEAEASSVTGAGATLMTSFPCRFAPAYQRLKERVKAGDIGEVKAICATNRGKCPFDWFVEPELSGGAALIDHSVHVADLLRDLLGEEPDAVSAQVGSNLHGQPWEDTAMISLAYPSGVFATLDASWSRPQSYKTWGDVTMNVVGERGVLELDLFAQQVQLWSPNHGVAGFSSNLDELLVDDWVESILEDRPPKVGLEDGLAASRVAMAAYANLVVS